MSTAGDSGYFSRTESSSQSDFYDETESDLETEQVLDTTPGLVMQSMDNLTNSNLSLQTEMVSS